MPFTPVNPNTLPEAQKVLAFWFDENNKPYWFEKNDDFDNKMREQFEATWQQGRQAELAGWRNTTEGALAEIIVLDQFSRNLFRRSPTSFSQDGMALILAQEAIKRKDFESLPLDYKKFILMPFMHSESSIIHEVGLELFKQLGDEYTLGYEVARKNIIDEFGRYPHRNEVLGRQPTVEEVAFLKQPNSSF